jgi:hypothetical protein
LDPFSFVFLLSGAEQYHIVLETLDTEEAAYVWHIDKNPLLLPDTTPEIEIQVSAFYLFQPYIKSISNWILTT